MEYLTAQIKDNNIPNIEDNVSCIGYFDGVHRGHQALIKVCKDLAKMNNLKSMVICFDPDPRDIISNCKNSHLLSFKDRLDAFKELGVDIVCIIKFDKKMTDSYFLDKLVAFTINALDEAFKLFKSDFCKTY